MNSNTDAERRRVEEILAEVTYRYEGLKLLVLVEFS